MELTTEEASLLNRILILGQEIEKHFSVLKENEKIKNKLHTLSSLLFEVSLSPKPELQRLKQIQDHLHPNMELRHFLNFLVPIERLCDRNLKDNEFLITTSDRAVAQPIKKNIIFVLHNIRSSFNVGSILRLAETLNCLEIHLVGYTPGPESSGVQKTAMGTDQMVKTKKFDHLKDSLFELREQGFKICALETSKKSRNLYHTQLPDKIALLVGNERFGLDPTQIEEADVVIEIPLFGQKNSLNVATAISVAAFEWNRQLFYSQVEN